MARRSPALSSLPKVSFQKVDNDLSPNPKDFGTHDQQARSYGYNDFAIFKRPDSYIRHIEPLEIDLARQVEYDMDEQDKEWLDSVNGERKKEQMDTVSYEAFEVIMDRLEKEWFDLTKNIPKADFALPSEDSTCAICDDSEGENSNAIVFCDGCNLAVHQDCYGVPYIPEGQWLCRKCTVSPENPVSCILCPNEGGAFKQTVHGEWAHLLCAIWIPETRVANEVFMEPVTGIEKISKQRWKLKCSVCDIREGACIQCAKTSCFLAFHTTCARKERLLLPMKSAQGSEPVTLTCYCDRHLPKEQQDARLLALAADEAREEANPTNTAKLSKSARAYDKTYKPGPPLVPNIIVMRIQKYIAKVAMRKRLEFLQMTCRYWSLKREARRGAPLLKRLHLEPWTASAGGKIQTEEEKRMKLDQLNHLLEDMKHLKELTYLTLRREIIKRTQVETIYDVIDPCLFYRQRRVQAAYESIIAKDGNGFFKNPVSKADVPDYYDIVKNPMCWSTIDEKLDKHEYWDVESFKNDIDLVINNAMLYNKPDTQFYKTALKIRNAARPILEGLNTFIHEHPLPGVGDLEPPLEMLNLLVSTSYIADEVDLILDDNPLAYVLKYELAQMKPPPPPPPPPPKMVKIKRDRRAEYFKRKQDREAIAAAAAAAATALEFEMLDESPGFRAPRTRSAVAASTDVEPEVEPEPQTVPEEVPEESLPKRSGNRKRVSLSLPDIPLVDEVDSQRSFKMFHEGWIFPPEQRRGGRAPVDRQVPVVPRPRKKMRTDPGPSRLSVVSTAASENQTLQTPPSKATNTDNAQDTSMEVDIQPNLELELPISASVSAPTLTITPAPKLGRPPLSRRETTIPPVNLVKMANGTIVVEELDTPAIRRQKSIRRKEEKLRLAQQALSGPGFPGASGPEASPLAAPSSEAGTSRHLKNEENDLDSELSSLSDLGSDEAAARKLAVRELVRPIRVAPPPPPADLSAERGIIVLSEGTAIEGGTLVWAKADTYPWWPAVIFDDDDPMVPNNIYQLCIRMREKRKSVINILRFYDKTSSWQCLPLDRLRLLGEDEILDEEMLAPTSRRQKWKSSAAREDCRQAYRLARAEMETGSETAENEREAFEPQPEPI